MSDLAKERAQLVSLRDADVSTLYYEVRAFGLQGRLSMANSDGKLHVESYDNSDIYLSKISRAKIVLGKYLLCESGDLIHEGLTYSNNTIIDPIIDPLGNGRGQEIINGRSFLRHEDLRVCSRSEEFEGVALINGFTTPTPYFGHWLYEHLPKIFLLVCVGLHGCPLLIKSTLPKRFLRWAEDIFDIKFSYVFFGAEGSPIIRDSFVPSVPSYRGRNGRLHVWVDGLSGIRSLGRVRARYSLDVHLSRRHRVLFIYRSSLWRNLVNQDALLGTLRNRFDVDVLVPEELGPLEQIRAVMGYNIIVGVSGSSMPLTLFADEGCSVLEIFSPMNEGKWAAKVYCDLFGMRHIRFNGHVVDSSRGPSPSDANFIISDGVVSRICGTILRLIRK